MSISKLLPTTKVATVDPIGDLASQLAQVSQTRSMNDEQIGSTVFATESLTSDKQQMLTSVANNMETTIKAVLDGFGGSFAFEGVNIEAATIGGMVATAPQNFLRQKLRNVGDGALAVTALVGDGALERGIAVEAYDERENRNAQLYTILFNLMASRQDEFGETWFPTININPTEVGLLVSVKLFYVYNDFKRAVTGNLANYGRVNLIRAYANSEVLKNELTRAVPVLRTAGGAENNADKFVDVADVPARSVELGAGISVSTGALKVDARVDLIGMSQTNELLNSGLMGPTDSLDAFAKLEAVYIKLTDDVIRVDVSNLPGSVFTYSPQGNSRRMLLDLDSDGIVLNSDTVNVDGSPLADLTELATHSARVRLAIGGNVVLDKGEAVVNAGNLALVTVRNAAGAVVSGGAAGTLATKLAGAKVVGYDLLAYRANSNIRQRGQLLDTQTHFQVLQVPYRSPVAVLAPVMSVGDNDTSAVQSLITTVGVRVSNEAVTAVIKTQQALAAYSPVATANGELPEMSAIGSNYVKPTYFTDAINLSSMNSVAQHERLADIRATLVEKIRYFANEMYRQSEYKAAADLLTGNVGYKPTVIIGTDPVLYNYIQADGELRTLGEKFDVKVVATLDSRVKGKIFMSFGVFDANRNTAVNPLNFGNMLYAAELVSNMPVARDGQTSNEVMVTPRFAHINHLPVMTYITVTGLPEATGKIAIDFKEV